MSAARRVVCTGLGVVSPLGLGVERNWSALVAARSGLVSLRPEHSFEGCQSRVAAYVPEDEFQNELSKHSYMSKNIKQLSRASSFAMLAAHEALIQARLLASSGELIEEFRPRCGVALGQGMVDFEDIHRSGLLVVGELGDASNSNNKRSGFRRMSPFFMTRVLINMSAGNISIRYKLNGPNHCVSTACASGAHSLGDGFNFIRTGQADLMVCGSTEASINSIAMAGFERLKALCTIFSDKPQEASRPFDQKRAGFVMGEGAGVVILEEYEHALKRGLTKDDLVCEMLGYGCSADGHHLTSPAPDGLGASLSMVAALRDAKCEPHHVSHINAHATSTPIGDDIECNAIEDLFHSDEQVSKRSLDLSVTSCKSAIGHLLGGAGSVESIFAMLSCQRAWLPPCLNLVQPLETRKNSIRFIRDTPAQWKLDDRILLKNSFGFGGTNASLIMSNIT